MSLFCLRSLVSSVICLSLSFILSLSLSHRKLTSPYFYYLCCYFDSTCFRSSLSTSSSQTIFLKLLLLSLSLLLLSLTFSLSRKKYTFYLSLSLIFSSSPHLNHSCLIIFLTRFFLFLFLYFLSISFILSDPHISVQSHPLQSRTSSSFLLLPTFTSKSSNLIWNLSSKLFFLVELNVCCIDLLRLSFAANSVTVL